MRVGSQLILTCLLAGALAGGWTWLGRENTSSARLDPGADRSSAGTQVLVEPLDVAEDRVLIRAVGTVDAQRSAAVHPSVAGEVVSLDFEAGQRVGKGEVLARLDDEHQRLAVRLAEVALGEAKREVARLEELARSGSVSKAGLQSAQAALQSASLRLAQASADLADRTVKAPFDGVVGLSEIEVGDRVTTNTLIATLDDRSFLLIDFNLPEDYSARIRVGDPVIVRPWSLWDRPVQGTVATLGSRIEPTSRSLRVRARIENPDQALRPGTSVEVELAFTGRAYPRVREVAVLWSRDGAYLWRANENKAERVFVDLVRRDRGHVLVDGELRGGDLIVVEGVQSLRAGQRLDAVVVGSDEAASLAAGGRDPVEDRD